MRPERDPDCLFCKIVAEEIPATIPAEDERTIAFMDINPATRGHALVIPRAHARDVHEIDPEDLKAVAVAAQRVAGRAIERLGADGVNLLNSSGAAAWQTVPHFHMHVIPRYEGDPLRLPWAPAPGDKDDISAAGAQLKGYQLSRVWASETWASSPPRRSMRSRPTAGRCPMFLRTLLVHWASASGRCVGRPRCGQLFRSLPGGARFFLAGFPRSARCD